MKTLILSAALLLMSFIASMPVAHAFSTLTGDTAPGTFGNLTDPDQQSPFFFGNGRLDKAPTGDNFDDAPDGQGFVSKDMVRQSMERGSGSYLVPDSQK